MATESEQSWPLFVTAARGLEPQLVDEVVSLGATVAKPGRGGVHCEATLQSIYAICLGSRLASRVLLPLGTCRAADATALYNGCREIDWAGHLSPGSTLAVDFSSSRSQLKHTRFGAQRVKDAIVDSLRELRGERPDVNRENPDCRINAYVFDNRAQLALDLGGGALHRRPWLAEGGRPLLPANLAAALLLKSGWPDRRYRKLVHLWAHDGTLAIEAAEIASGRAANRDRSHWGFLAWQHHRSEHWSSALAAAQTRGARADANIVLVEPEQRSVGIARSALRAADTSAQLHSADPIRWLESASLDQDSLVVATPLSDSVHDRAFWARLGNQLKAAISTTCKNSGCAAVLVPALEYGRQLGLRATKRNQYWLGSDHCTLLQLPLDVGHAFDPAAAERGRKQRAVQAALSRGAESLVNRIKKNQRTQGKWAARAGISCYRLYDADLPEYAFAIDLYGEHAHIQEYAAPALVDPARAAQRLEDAMAVLPDALGIPPERCVLKHRQRQRGANQYRKHAETNAFIHVTEGEANFAVNLYDYLDTGLFLDHRTTRRIVAELARGKRFLNLFAYTGSVTVQAALAGARSTLSVDLSQTYLDWARRNFSLNKLDSTAHRTQRANVLTWIKQHTGQYDVIFLDPPTFSNSKSMDRSFNVQHDHVPLIRDALRCLTKGGTLVFSNNHRRFRLDADALSDCVIENISKRTLPRDFARNPRIHSVWTIRSSA